MSDSDEFSELSALDVDISSESSYVPSDEEEEEEEEEDTASPGAAAGDAAPGGDRKPVRRTRATRASAQRRASVLSDRSFGISSESSLSESDEDSDEGCDEDREGGDLRDSSGHASEPSSPCQVAENDSVLEPADAAPENAGHATSETPFVAADMLVREMRQALLEHGVSPSGKRRDLERKIAVLNDRLAAQGAGDGGNAETAIELSTTDEATVAEVLPARDSPGRGAAMCSSDDSEFESVDDDDSDSDSDAESDVTGHNGLGNSSCGKVADNSSSTPRVADAATTVDAGGADSLESISPVPADIDDRMSFITLRASRASGTAHEDSFADSPFATSHGDSAAESASPEPDDRNNCSHGAGVDDEDVEDVEEASDVVDDLQVTTPKDTPSNTATGAHHNYCSMSDLDLTMSPSDSPSHVGPVHTILRTVRKLRDDVQNTPAWHSQLRGTVPKTALRTFSAVLSTRARTNRSRDTAVAADADTDSSSPVSTPKRELLFGDADGSDPSQEEASSDEGVSGVTNDEARGDASLDEATSELVGDDGSSGEVDSSEDFDDVIDETFTAPVDELAGDGDSDDNDDDDDDHDHDAFDTDDSLLDDQAVSNVADEPVEELDAGKQRRHRNSSQRARRRESCVFRAHRDALTQQYFQEFNYRVFGDKLPADLGITWNKRLLRTAGLTYTKTLNGAATARVELSCKVVDNGHKCRSTLLHELCHVAARLLSNCAGKCCGPHGRHFKHWARVATLE